MTYKKAFKWLAGIISTPIVLFLLLAILIYIPPIQNFAVDRVAKSLSESMGMTFTVDRVRLAFPLDLAVHRVTAVERGDTLLDARSLRLNVKLIPLFSGRADIDGFELYGVKLNTKSYISDTRIEGQAAALTAASHGVDWQKELIHLDRVRLEDADFMITLSDTAREDTTTSTARWNISVARADILRSRIRLSMLGDSMRIDARLGEFALRGGRFDTGLGYYAAGSLSLKESSLGYDLPHEKPGLGLDPNHIALTDLSLQLDTLSYASGGTLRVGLRGLSVKEKSGLTVNRLSGSVDMDSTQLRLSALRLRTPSSRVDADIAFDFRSFTSGKGGRLSALLDAEIGASDLRTLGRGYMDAGTLRALPQLPLKVKGEVNGNIDHIRIPSLTVSLPGIVDLQATLYASRILERRRSGEARFDLRLGRMAPVRALLPASLTATINIPNQIRTKGLTRFAGDRYEVDAFIDHAGGRLAAKGDVDLRTEQYRLTARSTAFPVGRFVKGLALTPFTGSLRASGVGFDPTAKRASLTADATIQQLNYDAYQFGGTKFTANLCGGQVNADFSVANDMLQASGTIDALIGAHGYNVRLDADLPVIDLLRMGLVKDTIQLGTKIELSAKANKQFTAYSTNGSITRNTITTPRLSNMAKDILFDFATDSDTTTAFVNSGDLRLRLGAAGDVPHFMAHIDRFTKAATAQLEAKHLDQEALKALLPVFDFDLDAGRSNPLYNFLRFKGYSFNSASLCLRANPRVGLGGKAHLGSLDLGGVVLDSIDSYIIQDSTGVQLYGLIQNNRHNPNPLTVKTKAYMLSAGAGIELSYFDSKGEKGVDLGLQAEIADGGINMHLYPHHPVLAYRQFTVNKDNFIYLGKNHLLRANVDLLADDGTGLKIYGEPVDSANDLSVAVNQVNLGELSTVLPYLPRMSGMLSGDFHVTEDRAKKQLSGVASLTAEQFQYDGTPLGDIGLEAIYLPKEDDAHHASVFISAGGREVLACNGTYIDKDNGNFKGDARLHDFPLRLLNGFLTGTDVALKGIAGGDLQLTGSLGKPEINGSLDLDSAHIYSDVYGFDFRTDEREVEIRDSRFLFSDYNLYSTGKQPLVLNGSFDMSDLSRMKMDINMRAQDFELINTRKKAQSMVFGKVYANFLGQLKGTTDNLSIRGKLEVLDRTDMTYILKDSPLSVDNRLSDLVQFVNFADTTAQATSASTPQTGFDLTLGIAISDAAQFHCNLSDDGQSYVNLEGGGDLTLRMTQSGEMRMTGLFTANSGQMKYALPVIPLKTFNLVQGSSVRFTGDIMNPTLNIAAKERTKAVVTENDKQRSVAFDVGVALSKPLNEMGLEFTIEAPEDLSVQNQLASMSKEQRGKAAVTMMATGMYMTDETMMSGSGFKANNALNAFLQSEIQNIAGSALKTIDINFGMESGTSEAGTATTDYSFQFAKRFWGNRISVIIGGKVSTGADAKNSAESFINNVSLEYRLDQSATRYVKVFYDRDTQDPLEGQLTKTGAGLVLRRKTDRLGELFIFKRKKATSTDEPTAAMPSGTK